MRKRSDSLPGFEPALAMPQAVPRLPGWIAVRGDVADPSTALFTAGAALHALDALVRAGPIWAGAWRNRLALECAGGACRLAGRTETQQALRDAWYLCPKGSDPGPAGNLFAAWRRLASHRPHVDAETLATLGDLMGLPGDMDWQALAGAVEEAATTGKPAPVAAATAAARVMALEPRAELLCWWLVDLVLARSLGWDRATPMAMALAFDPVLRVEGGRSKRIRPNDPGFEQALCLACVEGAASALRDAGVLARRAQRLLEVAPKLRAKGAPDALDLLLGDDAVAGTLATRRLSRFASRRLFARLEQFEAVRELTGRPSFRIYGL
ncbi:DUF1403 family protein [Aquamicrobium ahrensii]|uniref:DUF1403 family protein n=1 Tax=Aquamicrobium ahrensii TaxID=469551 RepID=A0ABV2KJV8_9HYPH